ncbi:MAG: YabP/YqfC family sporulation protein [Lachnospiraceae bacterium]|nr:YabP/YqfC family sporulation protein [Lachnospiraceae bacterium]
MEEKKSAKPHSILWKDRTEGSVAGVIDVLSFDENMVVLQTEQGTLTVKGKNLHIGRLELSSGEVKMRGSVDSIVYSGSNPAKKGSLMKRMFR